jgi:hypothetical protein
MTKYFNEKQIKADIQKAQNSLSQEIVSQCIFYRVNGMNIDGMINTILEEVGRNLKIYCANDEKILSDYKNEVRKTK